MEKTLREPEPPEADQAGRGDPLCRPPAARPGERAFLRPVQRRLDWVIPYPQIAETERAQVDRSVAEVKKFVNERFDPPAIDRNADISPDTIDELGRLGVLGMTVPVEYGGRGFSQMGYCRVMEEIGRACASTSVFINAHHSTGMRALLLFGTDEQKRKWLPELARGQKLAAFALTEPEAGSDAANVQTQAKPSRDGSHYVVNGQKRYITNGAIAQVLTVMARTPAPSSGPGSGRDGASGGDPTAITAFLVTPNLPGFKVVEPRMKKLGIRGTATAELAFHDMHIPKKNVLGPLGKGLKVALTVLDFGRTTFDRLLHGRGEDLPSDGGPTSQQPAAIRSAP